MRKFEARFFPSQLDGKAYVVVGHVVWDSRHANQAPRVEPASSLRDATAPATLLATLRHLVLKAGSKSVERLASFENQFWSFVEVDDAAALPSAPTGVPPEP